MTTRNLAVLSPPIFMSKTFINRGAEKADDLTSTQDAADTTNVDLLRRIFDFTRSSFWPCEPGHVGNVYRAQYRLAQ